MLLKKKFLSRSRNTKKQLLFETALLLTCDNLNRKEFIKQVEKLRPGSGVIFRSYGLEYDERLLFGQQLAKLCRLKRLVFLAAVQSIADLHIAEILRVNGIHIPEKVARQQILSPILGWGRRWRSSKILTVAAHNQRSLMRGWSLRADAALLSIVFPTPSHPGVTALGPIRFSLWCHNARLPVFALGGVRAENIGRLNHSGAFGVATASKF